MVGAVISFGPSDRLEYLMGALASPAGIFMARPVTPTPIQQLTPAPAPQQAAEDHSLETLRAVFPDYGDLFLAACLQVCCPESRQLSQPCRSSTGTRTGQWTLSSQVCC